MPAAPRLLLATGNEAKIRELSRLLSDVPIELVTPAGLGSPPRGEGTGRHTQRATPARPSLERRD